MYYVYAPGNSIIQKSSVQPSKLTPFCSTKPYFSPYTAIFIHMKLFIMEDSVKKKALPYCLVCASNLRTLQKSTLPTSASGEQWQEKSLCLSSAGFCGSTLVGHILGFGEDEFGEYVEISQGSLCFPSYCC